MHGGNNTSAIDCSHLVYQVYKQAGTQNIVFQTVYCMKNNKYYVNTTSPSPGDVIFWKENVNKNGKKYWLAYHVGIYIGNGQFIHASDETNNVTIDNISGMYKDGVPYYARWCPGQEPQINPKNQKDNRIRLNVMPIKGYVGQEISVFKVYEKSINGSEESIIKMFKVNITSL